MHHALHSPDAGGAGCYFPLTSSWVNSFGRFMLAASQAGSNSHQSALRQELLSGATEIRHGLDDGGSNFLFGSGFYGSTGCGWPVF